MSSSRRPLLHSDNNSVSKGSPIATNIDLNTHFDRRPIQTAGNNKKNMRSCQKAAIANDHDGNSCTLFKKFENDEDDNDKMGEYNLFASEKQIKS